MLSSAAAPPSALPPDGQAVLVAAMTTLAASLDAHGARHEEQQRRWLAAQEAQAAQHERVIEAMRALVVGVGGRIETSGGAPAPTSPTEAAESQGEAQQRDEGAVAPAVEPSQTAADGGADASPDASPTIAAEAPGGRIDAGVPILCSDSRPELGEMFSGRMRS